VAPLSAPSTLGLVAAATLEATAAGYGSVLDSDGDGQTDATELAAGTDPHDANSRFTLSLSTAAVPPIRTQSTNSGTDSTGQTIVLTWNSVPGNLYEIQKSTDLRNWSSVGQIQAEPAPATQTTAQVATTDSKAFYRIGVKNK